jgi:hypothetical protein
MKGLCFNGKMIDKDDTVHSKLIADGDVFEMVGSGGAKIEARHWWRGKRMTNIPSGHRDSWKLKEGTPEGLIFKARVDMHFCGVTWTRQHYEKAFSVKLAWRTRAHEEEKNELGDLSE